MSIKSFSIFIKEDLDKENYELEFDHESNDDTNKSNLLRRFQIFLNNYLEKKYNTNDNFKHLLNNITNIIIDNLYQNQIDSNNLDLLNNRLENDIDSYSEDELFFIDNNFEKMLDDIEKERYYSQNIVYLNNFNNFNKH